MERLIMRMELVRLSPQIVGDDPELIKAARDLEDVGLQFRNMALFTVARGDVTVRGLSWRCKAIANANRLRGEELFRFGILALNEGAIVVANVLARALDETVAAVVFSRRRIQRAVEAGDPAKLQVLLDRLTVGSRYAAEQVAGRPESFNVLTMVDELGAYLAELVPEGKVTRSFFRDNYEFVSEFVHPAMGSFAVYQKLTGGVTSFDRAHAREPSPIPSLASNLAMAGHFLLKESEGLADIPDLPSEWPSGGSEARKATDDLR
jgi:hypothetical protein